MTTTLELLESPDPLVEGATITYTVTWQGASSLASPTAKVYLKGTDISSTAMASGTHSVSGNVQTLKALTATAGHGGKKYVVVVQCSVDGNTDLRKFIVPIVKASAE